MRLAHGNLVGRMVPTERREELTVVEPLRGYFQQPGSDPEAVTLNPSHCHLAFESPIGFLYPCANRVARVGPGNDYRAVLWRARDGSYGAVLVVAGAGVETTDANLLKQLRGKYYGAFDVSSQWANRVLPGTLEAALAPLAPSAAAAALAAAPRGSFTTKQSVPAAGADQAVIWGDYRTGSEVLIRKLDGKTQWHVPLNGFAHFAVTTPGPHRLKLFMPTASRGDTLERDLDVELAGGHAYVVSIGIDDKPHIEDLGQGTYCERRKATDPEAKPGLPTAWLACMK